MPGQAGGVAARGRRVDNGRRRERAARAIDAYLAPDPAPDGRPQRPPDPDRSEKSIADLLCDLHHLADELGLDWAGLEERAARHHAEESVRHVVEITGEGFQVLDTETDSLRADVWASRGAAQGACDELNEDGAVPR